MRCPARAVNTIIDNDRVLVMQAGKASEFGPPGELLRYGAVRCLSVVSSWFDRPSVAVPRSPCSMPNGVFASMARAAGHPLALQAAAEATSAAATRAPQDDHNPLSVEEPILS